jgi:hypothetical protein
VCFISNCSGNENLLKLPRDKVYDMLIVKTGKKTHFEDMTIAICHLFPHMAPGTDFLGVVRTPRNDLHPPPPKRHLAPPPKVFAPPQIIYIHI